MMTLEELSRSVLARLPEMLPVPIVDKMGGRKAMAALLREDSHSLAAILVGTTLVLAHDEWVNQQSAVLNQLEQLAKECPGAGAEGLTPVRAASAAYALAARVVRQGR